MTTIDQAKRMAEEAMLKKHIEKTGNLAQTNLTVRDYFAAKALQGIMSHSPTDVLPENAHDICSALYKIADAMMEARK
jgi:hypothetical protein